MSERGTAFPRRIVSTRFCNASLPFSSNARERHVSMTEYSNKVRRLDVLREISVLGPLKWGFLRRGVKKSIAHFEANVILVSWPSFAEGEYYSRREGHKGNWTLTHVWGDEDPLRKRIVLHVLLEQREVFDLVSASRNSRNRVVNNQRAVMVFRK